MDASCPFIFRAKRCYFFLLLAVFFFAAPFLVAHVFFFAQLVFFAGFFVAIAFPLSCVVKGCCGVAASYVLRGTLILMSISGQGKLNFTKNS